MRPEDELESFARSVHSTLAAGHVLAAAWNHRRHNGWLTLFHAVAAAFEMYSALQHQPKEDK